jgi:hypothetical protein
MHSQSLVKSINSRVSNSIILICLKKKPPLNKKRPLDISLKLKTVLLIKLEVRLNNDFAV